MWPEVLFFFFLSACFSLRKTGIDQTWLCDSCMFLLNRNGVSKGIRAKSVGRPSTTCKMTSQHSLTQEITPTIMVEFDVL